MAEIIPRWEWRTFGESFGAAEDRIKAHVVGNFKKSEEKYILSRNSDENTKIRDDLMDIKSLKQVNANLLEQWYPVMKETFPLSRAKVEELYRTYFKVALPALDRKEYTYDQFVSLTAGHPDLRVVDVYKERNIYTINMAIVEIALTRFNGVPNRTVCVEHADPENVMKTVRQLGLEEFENINYIKAMKAAVGL